MTKIKLWISDIDGTLMNYDSTYTKEMELLIRKIQKKGIKLVLATGRMFMGAEFAAKKFNLTTPIVCYQGAMVRDKDKILWQSSVNNDIAREIVEYLREKNIHTNIYNNDTLYVEDDNKTIMESYCNGRGTTYKALKSFDEIEFQNISKILAIIYDEALMKKTKDELKEKYKGVLTIVQSAKPYLEITDKNASKGNALKFLKKYWNLSKDEVIASGDQDNDVDMLEEAGIRISVGNSSEQIKKVAQYNCRDVNSNELVELIERMVLCE